MSRALDISWQMTGNAKMLRAQLQASYDEQEILVQHQNDLRAERDHLYFALTLQPWHMIGRWVFTRSGLQT